MRTDTKSFFKIGIDAREVHFVIERDQHKCYDSIAEQITNDDLEIFKSTRHTCGFINIANSSRYTDKCNTTQGGADHTKRYQHPIAIAVTDKKRIIIGIP